MIKLTQIAEVIENGLNELYKNPETPFKIWATAGEFDKPYRSGNKVIRYIPACLYTTSSSNDANDLVMGVNGLSLEFAIPVKRPRTNASQTAQELQKVVNGQYPYIQEVAGVINNYFQRVKSFALTDGEEDYSVSFAAGVDTDGTIDINSVLGEHITVNVSIEVTFSAGGISSKSVKTYIDGMSIPYKGLRHGRSAVIERDVYNENSSSKNLSTSTAFSVDVEFPANSDNATKACIDYALKGKMNVAHFIEVDFNGTIDRFFMTLNTVQDAAAGIDIVGLTASFVEIYQNEAVLATPDTFQVGSFQFQNSTGNNVPFSASSDCLAYIAGNVLKLTAGEPVNVPISVSDYDIDDEAESYTVQLITDKAVEITSPITFVITKEAKNGE